MKRLSVVATAIGVLGLAGTAMAQNPPAQPRPAAPAPTQTAPARPAQPAQPAQPAARPPAAEPSVTGTVSKYDAATKMLSLTTARGQETIEIGAKTTVQDGAKSLTVNDLATLAGREVTVRYTEAGGKKTATSVTLAAARPAAATRPPAAPPAGGASPPAPQQQPRRP